MTIIQEYCDYPFASNYYKSVIERIAWLENALITIGFATIDELVRLEFGFYDTKYLYALEILADLCDEMSAPAPAPAPEECEIVRDSDSLVMSDENNDEIIIHAARYSPFMLV